MTHSSLSKFTILSFVLLAFAQMTVAQTSDAIASERGDSLAADSMRYSKWGFIAPIIRYFDDSNKVRKDKAFDISFIGGPHYSNEKKFGLGLLAAGVYYTDRTDSLTPPSNVSLYVDVSTSGFYSIGLKGTTRFRDDKYRINYKGEFQSMPDKFWGIGYDNDANNDTQTKYQRLMAEAKIDAQVRLFPDFYVGPMIEFAYVKGSKYDPAMLYLWRGEDMRTFSYAVGLQVSYDTRDNLTAPHRGVCLTLAQRYYGKWMGNTYPFSSTELTAAWYTPTWKDCTLAMQYHTLLTYGDTPWGMLAYMGGSYTMRGYYEGRYRDKGEMDFTAELRQRVYRRIGVVAWGGVGSIFPRLSCMSVKQLLPSYGVGLRWEFKKNVNVRFDVGFGKGEKGFVFNINEAF
ncbi:MAG: BamA/TamA family outer membrane protein [Muribaculaceae bacterium]|nr:BamA/TamA family outer membrane protein [Muribaculaceae bacterium]